MNNSQEYDERIKKLKIIVFDIDGVITDGRVLVDEHGKESKFFSLRELDSLNSIKNAGYLIAAITGESTPIVDYFRNRIPWDYYFCGCKDKVAKLKYLEELENITSDEICYIGDGKYDIQAITYAGFGMCPSDGLIEAKEVADMVLNGKGGVDCVQEIERLLTRTIKDE